MKLTARQKQCLEIPRTLAFLASWRFKTNFILVGTLAFDISSLKAKLVGVDAAVCFFVLHELFIHRDRGGTVGFLRAFRETLPDDVNRLLLLQRIQQTDIQELGSRAS